MTHTRASTQALKFRADITRSFSEGYQWSHKKDLHPSELRKKQQQNSFWNFQKRMFRKSIFLFTIWLARIFWQRKKIILAAYHAAKGCRCICNCPRTLGAWLKIIFYITCGRLSSCNPALISWRKLQLLWYLHALSYFIRTCRLNRSFCNAIEALLWNIFICSYLDSLAGMRVLAT